MVKKGRILQKGKREERLTAGGGESGII